jgi:WD40 repeat protein
VFSANNKWFVTARHGNEVVRLWDARAGKLLWEHRSKGQSLSPIGFVDGDDTVVLRGDNDGYVYLFDRANGTEKKSFPTAPPVSWGQTLLSPEGKQVVVCTSQPPAVWDLEGKQVAVLEGHEKWANVAAFSPDGKKLFTGSYDSFVIEREWPLGKPIRKIELGRDRVQRLAVSPDGKRLEVVFEGEQALIFYDLETGKRLPEPIDSHGSTVYGVECAPDGSLVSFGSDRAVRTWDVKTGKSVAQFAVDLDLNGRGFALSADGARVAVPNYDVKSIGIYERLTGKRLRDIRADHVSNQHLAFSPDGRFLAAIAKSDRSAQVWDADTGAQVLKVQGGSGNTVAGAFSADGRAFALADGGQVRTWDTATWRTGTGIQAPLEWAWAGTYGLAYSPDGRMIATAREDGVRLYEVATRRERARLQPPGSPTGVLRFSHNGRLLAWVNGHDKIHVLDVRTGALAGPFTGHDGGITGLTFTTDDRALASSSEDCTILIWDVSNKTAAKTSPDGNSDEDWQALRGEDAQKAFTAVRALAAHPQAALRIANEHLKPAEPIDPQWVAARLRDLDSQKFAERERATHELEESGDRVAAALEQFLATRPSAEARARAEKILAKNRGQAATEQAAQSLRALEVLEWIGTARALELVEKLAKGAEGVSLTEEAKRSLKRWNSPAE